MTQQSPQEPKARPQEEPFHDHGWREHLHTIIFKHHTAAGKAFDVVLMVVIALGVSAVCLESIAWIGARYADAPLRGPEERVHEHPDQHLLGDRHADDGRLRKTSHRARR